MLKKTKLVCFILVSILLISCSSKGNNELIEAKIIVTKDFSNEILSEENINFAKGLTVMEILETNLDIKTEYGGSFVNSINGLESGYTNKKDKIKQDWFYYVNGILTNVGAKEYIAKEKDIIWWDYHEWGNVPFTPAVIGAFPQPFLNGYQGYNNGTIILCQDNTIGYGEQLKDYLIELGVEKVDVIKYDESLASSRDNITIVISDWRDISMSNFWKGIQENRDKTGWFAELENDRIFSLNQYLEKVDEYGDDTGVILATGMGMGDRNPLWIITGTSISGIGNSIDMIIKNPSSIVNKFGVIINKDRVISLPVY